METAIGLYTKPFDRCSSALYKVDSLNEESDKHHDKNPAHGAKFRELCVALLCNRSLAHLKRSQQPASAPSRTVTLSHLLQAEADSRKAISLEPRNAKACYRLVQALEQRVFLGDGADCDDLKQQIEVIKDRMKALNIQQKPDKAPSIKKRGASMKTSSVGRKASTLVQTKLEQSIASLLPPPPVPELTEPSPLRSLIAGNNAIVRGDIETALRVFSESIAQQKSNGNGKDSCNYLLSALLCARSHCCVKLHSFDQALRDANAAIVATPSSSQAYLRRYVALLSGNP